jgi:hypothetical protein
MQQNRYGGFDQNAADSSDKTGGAVTGGVYRGNIVRALIKVSDSGAEKFQLDEVTLEDGNSLKFATMGTFGKTVNGGKAMPGYNKLNALMGMNGLSNGLQLQDYDDRGTPCKEVVNMRGMPICVSVQRQERVYQGKIKFDLEILHFFDVNTNQTYTEMRDQKEPVMINREIVDVIIDPSTVSAQSSGNGGGFGGKSGGFGGSASGGTFGGGGNSGQSFNTGGGQQQQQAPQGSSFGGQQQQSSFNTGQQNQQQQQSPQQSAQQDDNRNENAMNNMGNQQQQSGGFGGQQQQQAGAQELPWERN